jgi:hypothetical protein
MKTSKNKIVTILIAAFLMISMMASLVLVPVKGQFAEITPPAGSTVQSYAFLNIAPNPAGVGQTVTLDMFLASPLLTSEGATNMTIVETTPSGTTITLGPFTSDATGGTYTTIVPQTTGKYTFQFFYGGQKMLDGLYEGPSQTTVQTLVVQQTPIPLSSYPITALPTSWWQSPVTAENVQNWYAITGPWLGYGSVTFASTGGYNNTGNYNPYTQDVLSGHVLWTKPWAEGGVAGGQLGGTELSNFWSTSQYWPKFAPVIMNGIMYSTWYTTTTGYSNGIIAINLYTGQTEWVLNTTNPLLCGMETQWKTINMYGVIGPYIITSGTLPGVNDATTFGYFGPAAATEFNLYDALTGTYVLSIVNGTATPTFTTDANGNIIGYYTDTTPGIVTTYGTTPAMGGFPTVTGQVTITPTSPPYVVEWNMSNALVAIGAPGESQAWGWAPPAGSVVNFAYGNMWAKPMPTATTDTHAPLNNGQLAYTTQINDIGGMLTNNAVVLTGGFTTGQGTGGEQDGWLIVGAMDATTGATLFAKNYSYPTVGALLPFTRTITQVTDGQIIICNQVNNQVIAINARTGNIDWKTTLQGANGATPNLYNVFGIAIRNGPGMSIYEGFGGDIWGVNDTNGNIMWYTNTTAILGNPGIETPYGIWPMWVFGCSCVSNGVAYLPVGHEYNPPLFHGAQLIALNLTNGNLIWSELDFSVESTSITQGIILSRNAYDNQIYAMGKGPSQTTVTAPDIGVTTATPITITGSVMDISPGTKQSAVALNFPNGVPCVSDSSESHFMEYVYQQQPMPTNIKGVPVTLTETDHNGNTYTIGTTTTNAAGTFGYNWTPPIEGNYTITATFGGSNAYYGSCADTYIYANAPPATQGPTASPPSGLASTSTVELGIAAVIIVIVIIGAVLAMLMMRKHT